MKKDELIAEIKVRAALHNVQPRPPPPPPSLHFPLERKVLSLREIASSAKLGSSLVLLAIKKR